MRIAYPMRVDALEKPGGDTVQVREYIQGGKQLHLGGKPSFHGVILTDPNAALQAFDLVHLTNLDRPFETYAAYRAAKAAGKPVVFSTIHHSYKEIADYERRGRGARLSPLLSRMSFAAVETLRTLARSRRYPKLLEMVVATGALGVKRAQREMLLSSDRILVLSSKEREDILADCPGTEASRFVTVRNGLPLLPIQQYGPRDIDVAVVGRIEARKNQLQILEALEEIGVSGVFLGAENRNHAPYCRRFKQSVARSRSQYMGSVPREEALRIMQRAKVHVSASWFEVLSLVDLEAYSLGCRVVSSRCGGTRDVLAEQALYVDPANRLQIAEAIAAQLRAANTPQSEETRLRLESWAEVVDQLAEIYSDVLSNRV